MLQDEKNQVLTTNIWLDQEWNDQLLTWNPVNYGHTDIVVDIYSFSFMKKNILYFTKCSVRSSISELEAVMLSDYLLTDLRTYCFLITATLF